jgi:hypothetical protein
MIPRLEVEFHTCKTTIATVDNLILPDTNVFTLPVLANVLDKIVEVLSLH